MKKDNLQVQDVYEAIIVERDASNVVTNMYYFGATTDSGIDSSINTEELRAGIGNTIKSFKQDGREVNFNISNLFEADNFDAWTFGEDFVQNTKSIAKFITVEADASADQSLPAADKPASDPGTFFILDKNNNVVVGASIDWTGWTLNTSVAQGVVILWHEDVANVSTLAIGETSIPKSVEVQLHTIVYDPETQGVVADKYWLFPKALPDGNYSKANTAGTNVGSSINFGTLPDGNDNFAYQYIVPRV